MSATSHIETTRGPASRCDPCHEEHGVGAPHRVLRPPVEGSSTPAPSWLFEESRTRCRTARRAGHGTDRVPTPTVRSRRESTEPGEGPPEDPGTGLGAGVSRAVHEVRHRLHLPESAEEGPAQADPPVVLPDGGGEGQPRLRRGGRRYPRQ